MYFAKLFASVCNRLILKQLLFANLFAEQRPKRANEMWLIKPLFAFVVSLALQDSNIMTVLWWNAEVNRLQGLSSSDDHDSSTFVPEFERAEDRESSICFSRGIGCCSSGRHR